MAKTQSYPMQHDSSFQAHLALDKTEGILSVLRRRYKIDHSTGKGRSTGKGVVRV